MTVAELLNLGACDAASALGMNTDHGCGDLLKKAYAVWATPPSAYFDPAEDFDLDYIKSLQKAGNLIVIPKITTFVENGNDDAIETLEDDTQDLTNQGKYKFEATLKQGLYTQRALSSMKGFGNWRTWIVDIDGNIFGTQRAEGGAKGFTTGAFYPKKLTMPTSTTAMKQMFWFQLLNRFEVDETYAFFNAASLSFDPRLVEPVIQAYITVPNNPGDTDTTLTVKVVVDRGRKEVVSGAAFGQFLNVVNGSTSNPTAGDDSATAGTYPLTVAALTSGHKGTIRLYDNANNSPIIEIAGYGLVKSNVAEYTVTA